jgi:WD40 repeat protein
MGISTPGTELGRFAGNKQPVTSVTVLADGRRAVSGSEDRTLRLWEIETGADWPASPSMPWSRLSRRPQRQIASLSGDAIGRVHVVQIVE